MSLTVVRRSAGARAAQRSNINALMADAVKAEEDWSPMPTPRMRASVQEAAAP